MPTFKIIRDTEIESAARFDEQSPLCYADDRSSALTDAGANLAADSISVSLLASATDGLAVVAASRKLTLDRVQSSTSMPPPPRCSHWPGWLAGLPRCRPCIRQHQRCRQPCSRSRHSTKIATTTLAEACTFWAPSSKRKSSQPVIVRRRSSAGSCRLNVSATMNVSATKTEYARCLLSS